MPFTEQKRTFDFGPLGAPEFNCTIRDPKILKYREVKAFRQAGEDEEALLRAMAPLIVQWNLIDDQGRPLPLPKDQPSVLEDLPVGVLEHIAREIMKSLTPPNG